MVISPRFRSILRSPLPYLSLSSLIANTTTTTTKPVVKMIRFWMTRRTAPAHKDNNDKATSLFLPCTEFVAVLITIGPVSVFFMGGGGVSGLRRIRISGPIFTVVFSIELRSHRMNPQLFNGPLHNWQKSLQWGGILLGTMVVLSLATLGVRRVKLTESAHVENRSHFLTFKNHILAYVSHIGKNVAWFPVAICV